MENTQKPLIIEMLKAGKTYTEIGEAVGLSRQRIHAICLKEALLPPIEIRQKQQEKAYFDKWGLKEDTPLYWAKREKFRQKKANSKQTGWEWTISFGEIDWPTHCPILGLELDYFAEVRMENSPSFDRIDPAKGYVAGNVRIVSWRANRIKNDGSAKEHRLIAEYLEKLSEGT